MSERNDCFGNYPLNGGCWKNCCDKDSCCDATPELPAIHKPSKANSICFGVGNIDTVCDACEKNRECQNAIMAKVIGVTKAAVAVNSAELEQILEIYKAQCMACEIAFSLKVGSPPDSHLRIAFAREIGKREALELVLENVFSINSVTLESIHDKATCESKGAGRYDPERL